MNELTKAPKAPLQVGGVTTAIVPQDIEQAFRLANAIIQADMAPKAYARDPNKVLVGIMHGLEVGLTPMAALQSIAVINGMPSIWGDGALGLVQASGFLEDMEEGIVGEGDERTGICRLKRKGRATWIEGKFSVADAKKADLWTKKGPWQDYPQRMLQMRSRAWALRDGFADVMRGLHVREEVQDMGPLVDQGDGTYGTPPRPLREEYTEEAEQKRLDAAVKQAEADEAAMDEGFAGATTGRMPDTAEERGEEPEPEISDDTRAQTPSPADQYREQMFANIDECADLENLDALEAGAKEHLEAMDLQTVKRIQNRIAMKRQELKDAA